MADEINVHVAGYGADRNLMLRYSDPLTGKRVAKSAGTRNRREVEREAGKWQAELREGRYQKPNHITWEAFRERYAADILPGLAAGTAATYEATLNVLERTCNPDELAKVTTAVVTGFVTKLREASLSEATIARHLRGLRVVTRWANREGMQSVVPKFAMPLRAKGGKLMRGRAVSLVARVHYDDPTRAPYQPVQKPWIDGPSHDLPTSTRGSMQAHRGVEQFSHRCR